MDNEKTKERMKVIKGGDWLSPFSLITYAQLSERLEKYNIPQTEVDDILSVAFSSARRELEEEEAQEKNDFFDSIQKLNSDKEFPTK